MKIIKEFLNNLKNDLVKVKEHEKKFPYVPYYQKMKKILTVATLAIWVLVWILSCPALRASADSSISPASTVPSDLTGYTVTVPAGWSCTEGYGVFDISGTIFGFNFSSFGIGFNEGVYEMADYTEFRYNNNYRSFNPSDSLIFNISGGSDASNSTLLQWLIDNNASFVDNNPPPAAELFGLYNIYFTPLNISSGSTVIDNLLFYDLNMTEYNAIRFQKITGDVVFESISYRRSSDSEWVNILFREYSPEYESSATNQYGLSAGFSIFFEDSVTVSSSSFELIELYYSSEGYDSDLWGFGVSTYGYGYDDGIVAGYSSGYIAGSSAGYSLGYDTGFGEGKAEGIATSFLGSFFGGIIDALDNLTIVWGYSVLDVLSAGIGLCVLIFFLKLLAGG